MEASFGPEHEHGFNALLYADKGFTTSNNLVAAHKRLQNQMHLADHQHQENILMQKVRVSIEWKFADIASFQKYSAIASLQRVGNGTLGQTFTVAMLMHNCMTCLYGGKVSQLFKCQPPELRDYLGSHDVMNQTTHQLDFLNML